jgi:hypothetical protein
MIFISKRWKFSSSSPDGRKQVNFITQQESMVSMFFPDINETSSLPLDPIRMTRKVLEQQTSIF